MFKLIRKKIGCSTKKLYIVELGILKKEYEQYGNWFYIEYFDSPLYIVGKEKNNSYKNILTKEKYKDFTCKQLKNGDVIAGKVKPVITTQKRFKYEDVDKLIESGNCYYKVK